MPDLRTAAQQALEALEFDSPWREETITALRAALEQPTFRPTPLFAPGEPGVLLEQPEQEPVAWIQPDHLQKARVAPFLCRVEPTKRMADFVAIYTHPPRREWQGPSDAWKCACGANLYIDADGKPRSKANG